jgi:hypothetical protein
MIGIKKNNTIFKNSFKRKAMTGRCRAENTKKTNREIETILSMIDV